MSDQSKSITQYRMTWQGVDPWYAAQMEARGGKNVWRELSDESWKDMPWKEPTVRLDTDPWDQFNTLKRWQQTHEQPIRGLRLERREIPVPDEGWETVER